MPEQRAVSSSLLHKKPPSVVMQWLQITALRGKHTRTEEQKEINITPAHNMISCFSCFIYLKNQATEIDAVFHLTLLVLILFQIIMSLKIQNDYGILQWSVTPKLARSSTGTDVKYSCFKGTSLDPSPLKYGYIHVSITCFICQ